MDNRAQAPEQVPAEGPDASVTDLSTDQQASADLPAAKDNGASKDSGASMAAGDSASQPGARAAATAPAAGPAGSASAATASAAAPGHAPSGQVASGEAVPGPAAPVRPTAGLTGTAGSVAGPGKAAGSAAATPPRTPSPPVTPRSPASAPGSAGSGSLDSGSAAAGFGKPAQTGRPSPSGAPPGPAFTTGVPPGTGGTGFAPTAPLAGQGNGATASIGSRLTSPFTGITRNRPSRYPPKRPKAPRPAVRATGTAPPPGPGRSTRRAQLSLERLEPWSVMKFSFLVSLIAWVVLFVAVAILYYTLAKLGVFTKIENTVGLVTTSKDHPATNIAVWLSASRVLGYTMLVGAVNVVVMTALATIGAVLYNLVTSLTGGIEVTLKESD